MAANRMHGDAEGCGNRLVVTAAAHLLEHLQLTIGEPGRSLARRAPYGPVGSGSTDIAGQTLTGQPGQMLERPDADRLGDARRDAVPESVEITTDTSTSSSSITICPRLASRATRRRVDHLDRADLADEFVERRSNDLAQHQPFTPPPPPRRYQLHRESQWQARRPFPPDRRGTYHRATGRGAGSEQVTCLTTRRAGLTPPSPQGQHEGNERYEEKVQSPDSPSSRTPAAPELASVSEGIAVPSAMTKVSGGHAGRTSREATRSRPHRQPAGC